MSRVILITGGSGGVGSATANKFLENGDRVVITDINQENLDRVGAALQSAHGERLVSVRSDIGVVADCERAVAATVKSFGRLDVLVNAAGIIRRGAPEVMTEADWDSSFAVNAKGMFFMIQKSLPELEKTLGNIVNIVSDAGIHGITDHALYCASKGAAMNMTRSLALELAPRGIRVNALCPSDIMSPMLRYEAEHSGKDPEVHLAENLATYPQGSRAKYIQPEEVAEVVFFVASDRANMMTGAPLMMDNGCSSGLW